MFFLLCVVENHTWCTFFVGCTQARNQLGTPGGAKSFLKGAQIFWTMSNSFKRCPTHFSRGGEEFSRGASPTLRPPWIRVWLHIRGTPKPISLRIEAPWVGKVKNHSFKWSVPRFEVALRVYQCQAIRFALTPKSFFTGFQVCATLDNLTEPSKWPYSWQVVYCLKYFRLFALSTHGHVCTIFWGSSTLNH